MQGGDTLQTRKKILSNESRSRCDPSHSLKYWLALKTIRGIGNITALKLIQGFQSAENIFMATRAELADAGLKADITTQIVKFDFSRLTPILTWAEQSHRHIISFDDPRYPLQLKHINNPPMLLFVIGEPEILAYPQIAVVGTRNPTPQGRSNTQSLVTAMVEQGYAITSGLAIGIDGEAHRAALTAKGYTLAVMGTGLNRVYPAQHRELAYQISRMGALVSEKLPDSPLDAGSFPQRNRIIAGLSHGTLVVEAAQKSGSLITANLAAEQGREVYAIPGSIHNLQAKGCHQLIKQGAKLVESVEDILEDLPTLVKFSKHLPKADSQPQRSTEDLQLLANIDYQVTSLDSIIARSQLTPEQVINKLLEFELDGLVVNCAGGYLRQ